jgi:hypothetical protein
MMIQTQRLEYPDHSEEIASLNAILAAIPLPHTPEVKASVDLILARLDHLMTTQNAQLKFYDQRESRI